MLRGVRASKLILLALFTVLAVQSKLAAEEKLIPVPAAIQIASTISDGKYTLPEIVKIARENGMKIVVLTDRDFQEWEYGLWPLRKIIKKTVWLSSVSTYGTGRYLKEIEKLQRDNKDLVLIPGVESAPFYYWEGNPFRGSFKMYNWHKHILVVGMEKASDYKNLPSVANRNSLFLPLSLRDVFYLWPFLTLIIGILCLRKRKFIYKDASGRHLGSYSRPWQAFGVILIIISLPFVYEYFPFRSVKYDPYHGDQGVKPYQDLIDYVNRKGGLSFWAHPEPEYIEARGRIKFETREHTANLLEAHGYAGFAVFYEGYEKVGRAGGIWDKVLQEFCAGSRSSPMWAISGLAFDQPGDLDLGGLMQDLRTEVLVPRLNKDEVLNSLRKGRMYVIRGTKRVVLDKFILQDSILQDSLSDKVVGMGEEEIFQGKPKIKISGHFADGSSERIEIILIRNGMIIEVFDVKSPFEIDYQDDYFKEGQKIYYRLEIRNAGGQLVTNPIFVKFK